MVLFILKMLSKQSKDLQGKKKKSQKYHVPILLKNLVSMINNNHNRFYTVFPTYLASFNQLQYRVLFICLSYFFLFFFLSFFIQLFQSNRNILQSNQTIMSISGKNVNQKIIEEFPSPREKICYKVNKNILSNSHI